MIVDAWDAGKDIANCSSRAEKSCCKGGDFMLL